MVWEEKYPDGKTKFKYEYYVGGTQPKSEGEDSMVMALRGFHTWSVRIGAQPDSGGWNNHIVRANDNHVLVGYYKAYFETGKPVLEANFKDGVLDGKSVGYFENGQVEQEGNSKGGYEEGTWVRYDKSGKKWIEEPYVAGKLDGKSITYKPDGQISAESIYKNGECVSGCPDVEGH